MKERPSEDALPRDVQTVALRLLRFGHRSVALPPFVLERDRFEEYGAGVGLQVRQRLMCDRRLLGTGPLSSRPS